MSITIGAAVTAAKHLAEKEAVKAVVQYFKGEVIGRWSEHRADKFFGALLDEIRKERDVRSESADLNDMLRAITKSDKQTAALFDAYRRVALSASKDIGPRIIGLLTANIVLEDRDATGDEELIFQGAETLNDRDFLDLNAWLTFVYSNTAQTELVGDLVAEVKTVPIPSGGISLAAMAAGKYDDPMDLAKDLGVFALKLKNLGLLSETVVRRQDPGVPGATRYCVVVSKACQQLDRLATRAKSAAV